MLQLELLEDPQVIKFTHLNNAVTFRAKLTCDQYAEREWTISALRNPKDFNKNLGVYHFALRDLSIEVEDGDTTGNIVSSCETNNRRGWRIEPNGRLLEVVGVCIGSVYTLPEHRKKGYANALITKLNEYWDEKLGKSGFIFLYSEVGEYYSRFGYKSFNVPTHHINVPEELEQIDVHYLRPDEYSNVIEIEGTLIKQSLIRNSKTSEVPLISLDLDINTLTWFHLRDQYISSKVHPNLQVERYGAALKDGSDELIVWLHDWNDNGIMVLLLRYSSVHSFEILIKSALKEAIDLGLSTVTIWDSALTSDKSDCLKYLEKFGVRTTEINDSLSAIRICDGTTEFGWENNDKWCWF